MSKPMPDAPTLTAAQREAIAVAMAIDCRFPDDLFELVAGWLAEARAKGTYTQPVVSRPPTSPSPRPATRRREPDE